MHLRCILVAWALLASSARADRPNILLILADDLGSECLSAYGGSSYATPRIDAMAAQGRVYDHVYSTPKCSPSRVTLLTGRYTFRSTQKWGHIPRNEISFAQLLQKAGYATAIAGKWQLGRIVDEPDILHHFGFDTYCLWGWHEGPRYWQPHIWQDGKLREDVKDRYGPEVYTEFLIAFMTEQRDAPFLAYYPLCLPHFPKPDEPKNSEGKRESYSEMVAHMDTAVGRLIDALEQHGLSKNTLVLFTSDNGSPTNVTSLRAGKKVNGGKATLTNAGTHVPFIAYHPGLIPPERSDALIDFTDLLPTLVELGQATAPNDRTIDGKSFAWDLLGREGESREWVFTEWQGQAWIRTRSWKLYENRFMYDMVNDPEERSALSVYSDDATRAQMRAWLESKLAHLRQPADALGK